MNFREINISTSLLESLDWDDEKLNDLFMYLDIHFSGDSIISPNILLQEVENDFGKECAEILRTLFLEVSLSHGLFTNDPDIEH
tara:strand:- start:1089 stop:1340 length:252 start_codon:yes stop_codon:yes gene_type:complete